MHVPVYSPARGATPSRFRLLYSAGSPTTVGLLLLFPAPGMAGPFLLGHEPAAAVLGRLGGLKGGIARARELSPERRSEIARQAVEARWAKARGGEPESA